MNTFLPINNKKIGILGAARSGIAAANLARELGAYVFISDSRKLDGIETNGIEYEFGKHSKKILESDIVVKSPGIDNQSDIIKKIKKSSIPIVSEIEFASWFSNGFIIGLTGTNGKTTTVELINHILKAEGLKTFLGGNIGVPFSYNVLEELKNKSDINVLLFHGNETDLSAIYNENLNIDLIVRSKDRKRSSDGGSKIPTFSLGDRGKIVCQFDLLIEDINERFTDVAWCDRTVNHFTTRLEKMKKGDILTDLNRTWSICKWKD